MRLALLAGLVVTLLTGAAACSTVTDPFAPPRAPSVRYADALREAGLDSTRLGRAWADAADAAFRRPATPDLPAQDEVPVEVGLPAAVGWRIELRRGEVLRVTVAPSLADSATVFLDLFAGDSTAVRLGGWAASVDTLRVERRAERDEAVVVRLVAELLAEGSVSVGVETAPSLAFPVAGVGEGAIGSRWGAPRDGGARSHEGVDVFAERGTPVVAAAAGRVTRVQETPIGGLVVWLRPDDAAVSLYYAHLDRQLVEDGARVAAGDTLGEVGTTGNAAGTPPHLHFGVYGPGGAVDPEPFLVGRRPPPRTTGAARASASGPAP